MKTFALLSFVLSLLANTIAIAAEAIKTNKIVIAHRGASGYLPEHTLASASLAYGLGADYIEPDVVLTKDGVPVILHDIYLESTTNVALIYPNRQRPDGHWYAIDFNLEEIRRLAVHERLDTQTGSAYFPQRFPAKVGILKVPTLEELILLVQGLNRSTGRQVGIYPELKAPAFHEQSGQDLVRRTLEVLTRYGYTTRNAPIFIQSFDPRSLRRIRSELKSPLRLVQLIGENSWQEPPGINFDAMRTEAGLQAIASYADGIGPRIAHVLAPLPGQSQADPMPTKLVAWAHARGLVVHPYTVRADQLPSYARNIDDLHRLLFTVAGVDGVFSDFCDKSKAFVNAMPSSK